MPQPTTRRQFLARAAILAASAPALGAFLAACSKNAPSSSQPSLTIAAPNNPVKWPIPDDNKPIADGLAPEKGATLKIYNYADYLSPEAVKAFEDKYATKVEISTFNDGDEAITKLRSGVDFDIYNANYTEISRLVNGGLVRPLNHSYIPDIKNVWPSFTNPWYDQGWQYTVPYTIYTTGIGWRTDQVPADIGAHEESVRRVLGSGIQGQDRRAGRLPHHDGDGASAPRHYGHQHLVGGRPEDGRRATQRDGEGHLAEGHHHRLQRPSRRATRRCADVVGRHHQRAVLPARGHRPRDPSVLVPFGRQGHGRQRHVGDAQRRQEPGARAPVHQPHARPRGGEAELLRNRLPAATELDHPGFSRERAVHPGEPAHRDREAGVSSTPATGRSNSTRPTMPPGTTCGRPSRPADRKRRWRSR